MQDEELTSCLLEYVRDDRNRYAVMMTGDWGSGKTYFIENVLKPKIKEQTGMRTIRVSLYGLASVDGFYNKLVSSITSGENPSEYWDKAWDSLSSIAARTGKGFVKHWAGKAGISVPLDSETIAPILLKRKSLIVLDDFERCLIGYATILGIVNDLVENQNNKVIVVCDENKVPKNRSGRESDTISYMDMKEKAIWRTFEYAPDAGTLAILIVSSRVVDTHKVTDWEKALQSGVRNAKCHNARAFQKMPLILNPLLETSFFSSGEIDRCRAEKVLTDIIEIFIRNASGFDFSEPSADADESVAEGVFNAMEGFWLQELRSKNKQLSFLGSFLNDGLPPDIDDALVRYSETFYPTGPQARQAIEALGLAASFQYEDEAAVDILEKLFAAAESWEIPIHRVYEAIYFVSYINGMGLGGGYHSAERFVSTLEKQAEAHPEDVISIFDNRRHEFVLHEEFRDDEHVVSFDKHLEQQVEPAKSRLRAEAMAEASPNELLDHIRKWSADDFLAADPDRLAENLKDYDINQLWRFGGTLFSRLKDAKFSSDQDKRTDLAEWISAFQESLRKITLASKTRSAMIGRILGSIEDIDKM